MRSEHPEQSWEEPLGSLAIPGRPVFLHSQLWLSFLPKPAPSSLESQCSFCGSFSFGFSQGRGQAGLQCLTASLVLKSKPGTPDWATFTILTRGNLHHPQGLVEVSEWLRLKCSFTSSPALSLCLAGGQCVLPFWGPYTPPALSKGHGHLGGCGTAGTTMSPAHTLALPPLTAEGTENPLKHLKPIVLGHFC